MDRDENDLPKRPCYRCDYCCASFVDFNTLAVHFKSNCPKYFHHPSHSAAVITREFTHPPNNFQHLLPSAIDRMQQQVNSLQSFLNTSQFGSQLGSNTFQNAEHPPQAAACVNQLPQAAACINQLLMNKLIPERAFLCMSNLKSAMARKESTFSTFLASCAEVRRLAQKYSEVVQQKYLDSKAYNYARSRKNALCTISSEQELSILIDGVSKALYKVKIAFRNEEMVANLLRQAIYSQKKANEEAALATDLEQFAFTEAIRTFKQEVVNLNEESRAVYVELAKAKNAMQHSALLISLQEKADRLKNSLLSVMQTASKVGYENEFLRQTGENAAAAISNLPRECLCRSENIHIPQTMDLERAELAQRNGLASSSTESPAGPSENKN